MLSCIVYNILQNIANNVVIFNRRSNLADAEACIYTTYTDSPSNSYKVFLYKYVNIKAKLRSVPTI